MFIILYIHLWLVCVGVAQLRVFGLVPLHEVELYIGLGLRVQQLFHRCLVPLGNVGLQLIAWSSKASAAQEMGHESYVLVRHFGLLAHRVSFISISSVSLGVNLRRRDIIRDPHTDGTVR